MTNDHDPAESIDVDALKFVGPATAPVLEDAGIGVRGIKTKAVSYEMLIDAGVNPGVAARIRREHSLSWSFEGSGRNLDRRSSQIRGLHDDERAWIAASSGDWDEEDDAQTADGGGTAEDAERAWRERSAPESVTVVPDIDDDIAAELARGGITSLRSLAIADPEEVAESLEFSRDRVDDWREAARERI